MDYEREQELRGAAAAGDERARDARRQLTVETADSHWRGGDRAAALRVLYNSGLGDDMVGFCRERGLSDDEARAEIRTAQIDWA